MRNRIRGTWRALWNRGELESRMQEELAAHIEARAGHLRERGLPPREALRQARLELGSAEHYKEECRRSLGLRVLDELRQDIAYAFRGLRRAPVFAGAAIVSVALCIGVNMAAVGVTEALLLRPLPVPDPSRLVTVQNHDSVSHSFPVYRELRDRNTTLAALAGFRIARFGIGLPDGALQVWGYLATGNYFETLGVQPALGRFFGPDDDRVVNGSPYAVLSYDCWRNRFAGDPGIAGKTVLLNAHPYTILGVAPRGFRGSEMFYRPEVWTPMSMQPQIEGRSWLETRSTRNTWVIGRMKPGVSRERASADLDAIAQLDHREHSPASDPPRIRLTAPGWAGEEGRGPLEAFAGGILFLAALVLLAGCANLASLMAARASDRTRELAIRLSLGAGRSRIARQLMTESIVIAFTGGALGHGLAHILLRLLAGFRLPLDFPVQLNVEPDSRIALVAVAVSLLSGLLFGIAPARQAWRSNPNSAIKGSAAFSAGRRWPLREVLLAAQAALCCVLISCSIVALRGMNQSLRMPVGFEPEGIAMAGFDMVLAGIGREPGIALRRRILDEASDLPGVSAAAITSAMPLTTNQNWNSLFAGEVTDPKARPIGALYYSVSPGYFHLMKTRILEGRDLTWRDDEGAPAAAIVNRRLATLLFPNQSAIGKRFRYGRAGPLNEVVGVVEDGKYASLTEPPTPAVFQPAGQWYNPESILLVRTSESGAGMANQLRRLINRAEPRLAVFQVCTANQMLQFVFLPGQAAAIALSTFGLLAVALSLTGIHGLAAYAVSRRRREIGIRVAIGATAGQVALTVLARTSVAVGAGTVLGLGLAMAAARILASVVYLGSSRDPAVIAAASLAMLAVGIAAVFGPTRSALSVSPVEVIRLD